MKRYAGIIGLREDQIEEYKRLHADVWPTVLSRIKACNISNYFIFLRQPENLLLSFYEYTGTDHGGDMALMASDPETQRWWALCGPMQLPLESRRQGEWWASTDEVFHLD